MASRMVPPPMPVTVPSMMNPTRSICLRDAASAPVVAKTATPNQSSQNITGSNIVLPLWLLAASTSAGSPAPRHREPSSRRGSTDQRPVREAAAQLWLREWMAPRARRGTERLQLHLIDGDLDGPPARCPQQCGLSRPHPQQRQAVEAAQRAGGAGDLVLRPDHQRVLDQLAAVDAVAHAAAEVDGAGREIPRPAHESCVELLRQQAEVGGLALGPLPRDAAKAAAGAAGG